MEKTDEQTKFLSLALRDKVLSEDSSFSIDAVQYSNLIEDMHCLDLNTGFIFMYCIFKRTKRNKNKRQKSIKLEIYKKKVINC